MPTHKRKHITTSIISPKFPLKSHKSHVNQQVQARKFKTADIVLETTLQSQRKLKSDPEHGLRKYLKNIPTPQSGTFFRNEFPSEHVIIIKHLRFTNNNPVNFSSDLKRMWILRYTITKIPMCVCVCVCPIKICRYTRERQRKALNRLFTVIERDDEFSGAQRKSQRCLKEKNQDHYSCDSHSNYEHTKTS